MTNDLLEERALGRKISIIGCGYDAEVFYHRLKIEGRWNRIDRVFDNYKCGRFHGKEIYSLEENMQFLKDCLLVVTSRKWYDDFAKQLTSYGLYEFEDFFGISSFDKKLVFFNANCYISPLACYLRSNKSFNEKYSIIYDTPVFEKQKLNRVKALEKCDICLTMDIKDDNEYGAECSVNYLKKIVRDTSQVIVIPNLVGFGKAYFIQCSRERERFRHKEDNVLFPHGLFPYPDFVIENMMSRGLSCDKIIKEISKGGTFSDSEILDNYKAVCNRFLMREREWDIKIFDFIFEIEKKMKIMYDVYHPCGRILKEIARRILSRLDIRDLNVDGDCELDSFDIPLYPEVRRVLHLNWDGEVKRSLLHNGCGKMSSMEYQRTYVHWSQMQNSNLH